MKNRRKTGRTNVDGRKTTIVPRNFESEDGKTNDCSVFDDMGVVAGHCSGICCSFCA